MRVHRHGLLVSGSVVIVSVLLAACGGSDSVSSSTVATTAVPPVSSTDPPATTAAPVTTAPPTTAPPATTSPPATSPPTTPPATSPPTTAAPPAPPAPATYFAIADDELIEVDVATGALVRVIDEFFSGEGVFRGSMRLSPDRSAMFFSEGYEDSWYQCETSKGSFGAINLETGESVALGTGSAAELSYDGSKLVYLTSGLCLPDPEAPELFVLTPYDRAVVVDLVTGDTIEYVTNVPPEGYGSQSSVQWADTAPDGSLLVLTVGGDVHRIPAGATGAIQDFPLVASGVTVYPIEVTADAIIAISAGAEGSNDLVAINPATNDAVLLASCEEYMAVGVGPDGQLLAASTGAITVSPGAPVTVVSPPADVYYYDIEW